MGSTLTGVLNTARVYKFRDFNRAMLHIAQTMPSQDVRLSVCLSCSGFVSKRLDIIIKLFSPLHSDIISFPYQTVCQHSDGDPITGASNARGIKIFRQYFALSRKRYKIEP